MSTSDQGTENNSTVLAMPAQLFTGTGQDQWLHDRLRGGILFYNGRILVEITVPGTGQPPCETRTSVSGIYVLPE